MTHSPPLSFTVVSAAAEPFAATPTLGFRLAVSTPGDAAIRSVLLTAQIRIAVDRRLYSPSEQARLNELFGSPDRWRETLRSLYWTHATVVVPPFSGSSEFDVRVPCTYDFDVVATKYFNGLESGEIPLEFLLSGGVFFDDADGRLQTARLSWESETAFRLPVRVWKDLLDQYFPGMAWIRLQRDAFDRLYEYKAERALPTWEAAIDALLADGRVTVSGR